jgi:hypothetical protein
MDFSALCGPYPSFARWESRTQWPYDKPIFVQIPWASDRVALSARLVVYFSPHPSASAAAVSASA